MRPLLALTIILPLLAQRESGGIPVASFSGSGRQFAEAMTTDSQGNIYVAGNTSSPDFPVVNAEQPKIGESRALRSSDAGATWSNLASPTANLQVIEPDPSNAQTIFGANYVSIYRSGDGGTSWQTVYSWTPTTFPTLPSLAIDPGNTRRIAALDSGTLVVSTDGGQTWATGGVPLTSGCGQVVVDPFGSGTLAIACLAGVYLSRDWGATIQSISPVAAGGGNQLVEFDPWHRGWIYAAPSANDAGRLYVSMDSGQTWTQKTAPPVGLSEIWALAPDPDQPNVWYATTTSDQLFQTPDGGATWTALTGSGTVAINTRIATLSRSCGNGGGLFVIGTSANGAVLIDPAFSGTWRTSTTTAMDLSAGPACSLYAAHTITGDAFVAKLTPDGTRVLWSTFLGGSGTDGAKALSLDGEGNLWVTGSTASPDFPATSPRIGTMGASNVFVAKFGPTGALLSSVVLGGSNSDTAADIAVDGYGNTYVVGSTNSPQFPVTTGAFETKYDVGLEGFVVKIGPDFHLAYGSFLGGTPAAQPNAVAVDANGQAIVAGSNAVEGQASSGMYDTGFLVRFDPSGSRLTYSQKLATPAALKMDGTGDLFAIGQTFDSNLPTTPGAYRSAAQPAGCPNYGVSNPWTAVYVTKLRAADFAPAYAALMTSNCATRAGSLQVDDAGVATFSVATGAGYPLVYPHVATSSCQIPFPTQGAVSQLSADGSAILFSTLVDSCGAPPVASPAAGTVFAALSRFPSVDVEEYLESPSPRRKPRRY